MHCKGIPLDYFPKTFRESIEVARGLGVQYVWIDSLCIVQDDKADWEVEAGRMADVYSNAFATIFADRATHSDDGLFQNKKDGDGQRSVRAVEFKDHNSGIAARVLVQTQINSNIANFATDVSELFCLAEQSVSQLTGRGWILQEEALSRRRIHFTETELKWKCASVANCDCGLRTQPDMADPSRNFAILEDPKKGKTSPWTSASWLWQKLIEHYTSRSLTYESDRLIALAGMATKIPRPPKDYLAGMFRDQLDANILWEAKGAPSRCYRTKKYVAPSWSWASVSGKIRFIPLSSDMRWVWKILDAQCSPEGNNSDFGQVASGYLRIRSKVSHVQVEERPQNMRKEIAQEHWDAGDAIWRPRGNEVRYLAIIPAQAIPDASAPPPSRVELDVQSDWDELISGNQSDLRLLCVAITDGYWEGCAAQFGSCLLLKRSLKQENCWERVCYVTVFGTWKSWEPYVADEEVTII